MIRECKAFCNWLYFNLVSFAATLNGDNYLDFVHNHIKTYLKNFPIMKTDGALILRNSTPWSTNESLFGYFSILVFSLVGSIEEALGFGLLVSKI